MRIPCAKGCGGLIEVSTEQMQEIAALNNGTVVVEHDVCPRDMVVRPRYRFVITVEKYAAAATHEEAETMEPERIAQAGDVVEAESFEAALAPLTKSINKQWEKISEMAAVADMTD